MKCKNWVYHVCSPKKFLKYLESGLIKKPFRAWETIKDAERFSRQTTRPIILRLPFPVNASELDGHRNKAIVLNADYYLPVNFCKPKEALK